MELKIQQLLGMVQDSLWAMYQPKLEEISLFFENKINGVDFTYVKNASERSGGGANDSYQILNSVAIIPVFGSLLKRANLFSSMSGGTSMQIIQRDIAKALSDEDVEAIVLDVDSPGGTVDGTKELADFIYNCRGTKPIVAYADGMMCSAAYWVSSAADCIIAFDTSLIGSIGVATVHFDRSGADEKAGVKRTINTAGKFKQAANDAAPLSDPARKIIQEQLDDTYALFTSDVARNLGVEQKQVLKDMAEGLVFMGQKAMDVGLVHEVGDINAAILKAKQLSKGKTMTFAEYQKQHPAEAQAGIDSALATEKARLLAENSAKNDQQSNADVLVLQQKVTDLTTRLEASEQKNKSNELALVAMEEKALQTKAESILSKNLSGSTLQTKAKDKVRAKFTDSNGKIAVNSYMTEQGSLDETKFGKAITDEIADYESLVQGARLPLGQASESTSDGGKTQVEEDIAFAQEMVHSRFGKQDR